MNFLMLWKWSWDWRASESGEADCGVFAEERPGMAYAVCRCPRYMREEEWRSIAPVLAAAPDLLAACEAAIDYAETCRDMPEFSSGYCIGPDHYQAIKAAIAKAKGEFAPNP